jgi:hypothetical protein
MPDEIKGIAVMDRRCEDGDPERLEVMCHCSDGRKLACHIPVYAKRTPKTRKEQWQYEVKGDRLDVTPSLNWVGTFHNGYNWSVQFVEFDADNYPSPRAQLRAINP